MWFVVSTSGGSYLSNKTGGFSDLEDARRFGSIAGAAGLMFSRPRPDLSIVNGETGTTVLTFREAEQAITLAAAGKVFRNVN